MLLVEKGTTGFTISLLHSTFSALNLGPIQRTVFFKSALISSILTQIYSICANLIEILDTLNSANNCLTLLQLHGIFMCKNFIHSLSIKCFLISSTIYILRTCREICIIQIKFKRHCFATIISFIIFSPCEYL